MRRMLSRRTVSTGITQASYRKNSSLTPVSWHCFEKPIFITSREAVCLKHGRVSHQPPLHHY